MCSKSCDLSWLHCASVHCTVQGFIKCKVIEESLEIIPAVLSNWLVCQTPEFGKPKIVIFSKLWLGLFFFLSFCGGFSGKTKSNHSLQTWAGV